MRQFPGLSKMGEIEGGEEFHLISHHLSARPLRIQAFEQFALRGFPGAIGSFERHQESRGFLSCRRRSFAESSGLPPHWGTARTVYTEYTLQS